MPGTSFIPGTSLGRNAAGRKAAGIDHIAPPVKQAPGKARAGATAAAEACFNHRFCPSERQSPVSPVSPDIVKEFAPTGTLRAAINHGNSVLAQKGANGEALGITVDLARELAKRLGVPIELSPSTPPARCSTRSSAASGTSPSSRSSRCARPRSTSPRPMC